MECDLCDRCAVMGVDHGVGRGRNRAVLGRHGRAPAKEQHIACGKFIAPDLDEMFSRGGDQRIRTRFCPVGRIRRRQFGLVAHDATPDSAQQPEAVAADALERRLMAVRCSYPGARFGEDEV
jgi:hypothetical protein